MSNPSFQCFLGISVRILARAFLPGKAGRWERGNWEEERANAVKIVPVKKPRITRLSEAEHDDGLRPD